MPPVRPARSCTRHIPAHACYESLETSQNILSLFIGVQSPILDTAMNSRNCVMSIELSSNNGLL